MTSRRFFALVILLPLGIITMAAQVAIVLAALGGATSALGAQQRSSSLVGLGTGLMQRSAGMVDLALSLPTTRVLETNPLTMGVVDDLRGAAHAAATSTRALTPAADAAAIALGFDGQPPLLQGGSTISTSRVRDLAGPVADVHADLAQTGAALAAVEGDGLLGRPIGTVTYSIAGSVGALTDVTGALNSVMPVLPEALGEDGPRRYLVTALNDAELFGSGGAPLSAFLVEADKGAITVPISGQLESKLSPGNPPITWDHVTGPPWYAEDGEYPFVNSNFHPDFPTASADMRRAWAALKYPRVQGVVTIDMQALARLLDWTGSVRSPGFGRVTADNLVRTVLVDAYRDFNTTAGVGERHAQNEALTNAVADHITKPQNLIPALRGALSAIPGRHIQMSFDNATLEAAAGELGASGRLAAGDGDLIGAWSQSGPNKLSVFQERTITQEVTLSADGGARVHRTVTIKNAIPEGLEGDPTSYRGYLALLSRVRVAHRLPTFAEDAVLDIGEARPLVGSRRLGPTDDAAGGAVLWQGQDIGPDQTATIVIDYVLPAGTFPVGTYSVQADPQAMTSPSALTVRVTPADGQRLPDTAGWKHSGGAWEWKGTLDRPLELGIG